MMNRATCRLSPGIASGRVSTRATLLARASRPVTLIHRLFSVSARYAAGMGLIVNLLIAPTRSWYAAELWAPLFLSTLRYLWAWW